VLWPHGGLTTPAERVLPQSVATNEYVQSLVHPRFAEVQQPWGAAEPFVRPSAPFPYTNGWGCNVALLAPFMAAAATGAAGRRARRWAWVLVPLALVPALATLNRGMFLAVGVAAGYTALRFALHGRGKPLAALLALGVVGLVVATSTGVVGGVEARTTVSSTTSDRLALYYETVHRTLQSPVLGYGGPRPSETMSISVGTQGHLWNLMFSYGLPALGLFLVWMGGSAWRSRTLADPIGMAAHVSLVVASVVILYYGFDGPQLATIAVAAALTARRRSEGLTPRSRSADGGGGRFLLASNQELGPRAVHHAQRRVRATTTSRYVDPSQAATGQGGPA